jgi:GNAT superfamily N-acetyltransferase
MTVHAPSSRRGLEIVLRPAVAADVPVLVDLVQSAYRGEGGWTTEAHLVAGSRTDADGVRAMLADEAVTLLVAQDEDGGLLGCCYTRCEPTDPDGIRRAELGLFAVHPSAQSRGLGATLLEAQADHLRAAGVDVLVIQVLQGRPELHAWYRRHGFTPTGRCAPFAGDAHQLKVDGLGMDVMERPLQAP